MGRDFSEQPDPDAVLRPNGGGSDEPLRAPSQQRLQHYQAVANQSEKGASIHLPAGSAHQRPPPVKFLLLLRQRHAGAAVFQLSSGGRQRSGLRGGLRNAQPAVQPQRNVDGHSHGGQRGPLHLFPRRAAQLQPSAEYAIGPECLRHGGAGEPTASPIRRIRSMGSRRTWEPITKACRTYQRSGGFSIGNNFEGELPQIGNSFQWSDSLSKVMGAHSLKFGVDVRRMRFDQTLYYNVERLVTRLPAAAPTTWAPTMYYPRLSAGPAEHSTRRDRRSTRTCAARRCTCSRRIAGRFAPNLTLNYGLRWELDTPLTDIGHHVQTFRPGQVTSIFLASLRRTIRWSRSTGRPIAARMDRRMRISRWAWFFRATPAFLPA